ncbi:unnamed protein product, partial [Protopolystoma xenopodis]
NEVLPRDVASEIATGFIKDVVDYCAILNNEEEKLNETELQSAYHQAKDMLEVLSYLGVEDKVEEEVIEVSNPRFDILF